MSYVVLVSGSRDWADRDRIADVLSYYSAWDDVTILHGACSRWDRKTRRQVSADMLADEIARAYGYEVRPFPADWQQHGKAAGRIRTYRMLDECPDEVQVFQRNRSAGAQIAIDEARRRGFPVEVHTT